MVSQPDSERVTRLRRAESNASRLFDEVVDRGLIVPGKSERELSDEIRDLAATMFGVRRYWHKRIVRAGANALQPFRANPPDRIIGADDVVFIDFGPVFEEWEADFGRTFVLGNDERKHRLNADLAVVWHEGRDYFDASPEITGAELFHYMDSVIGRSEWGRGGSHAGHLVGEFPHERISGREITSYIALGNTEPMRRDDPAGMPCHWILEVHLVDPAGAFGGFYEQLLDI